MYIVLSKEYKIPDQDEDFHSSTLLNEKMYIENDWC